MATDIEESDYEDHERPAPPKRKCIKIINDSNENGEQSICQPVEQSNSDNGRLTREILLYKPYDIEGECYMGSLDNTINRVMEAFVSSSSPLMLFFREADMEERAVMMAIRNHGLVHAAELAANSFVTNDTMKFTNSYSNDSSSESNDSSSESNNSPSELNDCNSESAKSSDIFTTETFRGINDRLQHNWSADENDDSNQQQDILERAVVEAIKIKGLSTPSVDDG